MESTAGSNDNVLTCFAPLPKELENGEASSGNIFGNLFSKIFSSAKDQKNTKDEQASCDEQQQSTSEILSNEENADDSASLADTNREDKNEDGSSGRSSRAGGTEGTRKLSIRVSSLFRSRRASLIDYNRSDIRRYWMPDSTGRECYECRERFTTFRRRHHCRLCGQIFCSKCCSVQIPGSLLGYMGDLRLCAYCARIVMSYIPQSSSASPSSPQQQTSSDQMVHKSGSDALVSTVSSGSILWEPLEDSSSTHNNGNATANIDSLSLSSFTVDHNLPSVIPHQPSLLSVSDLVIQNSSSPLANSLTVPSSINMSTDNASSTNLILGVDDCEPDWVRSIEMTTDSANKRNESFIKTDDANQSKVFPFFDNTECGDALNHSAITNAGKTTRPKFELSEDLMPIDADIDKSFEERAQKLLLYLFERELLDPAQWWDVIWPVSRRVSEMIKIDSEGRKDHINILKYVHIKKLCVHEKPSASVVEGVVCSKSVTHSSMPTQIQNAAVMTLAGSVEYERVAGRFSSIDAIIAQENDYLSKQVERILAQRPSVVVVEENVARLAVYQLLKAGVSLVSNIKTKVLHRVARSTHADVMPSLDAQLLQQKIGFCPMFSQCKIRLASGKTKTLLIFSECSPDLGCSVLLRGQSMRELRAAKRILRYMILALYSANLELKLLKLFNSSIGARSSDCYVCSLNSDEVDPNPDSFTHHLRECTLTASPLINFGVPFLETAKGRECVLRPYFKHPLYHFLSKSDLQAVKNDEEEYEEDRSDGLWYNQHEFVYNRELREVNDDEVALFRAESGIIFRRRVHSCSFNWKSSKTIESKHQDDVLDPFIHQRIAVLFGSFSAKSPNAPFFCVRPWVVQMEHYGYNDMCLGDFLKKFCFNKDYQCPSTNCDVSMLDHSRKMVYRNVCIEITTQNYIQPIDDINAISQSIAEQASQLLSWLYCPICKASSSIVQLNDAVVNISFAKYLDYLANGMCASCSISSFNRECSHCLFHQHDHYFAFNNCFACFKVHPVRPYHVTFSPVVCTVDPLLFTRKFVDETENEIRATADSVFSKMISQLEQFKQTTDYQRYVSFYALLSSLVQQTQTDFSDVLNQFDVNRALKCGELTIRSNDGVYIQAVDTVARCRYIVQRMIDQWNEQSLKLSQTIRLAKKTASSSVLNSSIHQSSNLNAANDSNDAVKNSESTKQSLNEESASAAVALTPSSPFNVEVELTQVESPFLPQLHLSLPISMNGAAIVIRDLIDSKGMVHPDIGSIIAYALSSNDYGSKRKKMRDMRSFDGVAVNLKTNPTESDIVGNYEHIEVDFADDRSQYFVKIYYAERFHMLRKLLFVEGEDCFIRSLSVSTKWNPQGGKSGASFYQTHDTRFVFKQMSRFEIQSFVKFAPNYFDYVSTAVTENKLTTLCKVYGVYRIGYKNKQTGHQLKLDVLVMEYLFYKRNVKQVWDLKGSQRNRMASEGKKTADLVLLDENLVKDLWNNQLYVHPHSKAALNMAISNDSHFLSAQHVMDYSLLVGVDQVNGELILGIVDYMRTYTLDKKLESWVKIVAIPGAHLPTVISPEMYCTRFSDAIDTYFPVAPDQWTGLGSAMSY